MLSCEPAVRAASTMASAAVCGSFAFSSRVFELVDGDALDDPVGAEHEPVAVGEGEFLGFGAGAPLFGADVPPQHVLEAVGAGLVGGDRAGVDQGLRQGMVLGQLFDFAARQPKGRAVAHAADVELARDAQAERRSSSPSCTGAGSTSPRAMISMLALRTASSIALRTFSEVAVLEVEVLFQVVGDELDGHFAGFFAGRLAAHAVADDEITVPARRRSRDLRCCPGSRR